MAGIKKGRKIASGQVPEEVYQYLEAFVRAKGSTMSKQVCAILSDWAAQRYEISETDAIAHRVAEEKTSYGRAALGADGGGARASPRRLPQRKTGTGT